MYLKHQIVQRVIEQNYVSSYLGPGHLEPSPGDVTFTSSSSISDTRRACTVSSGTWGGYCPAPC